MTLTRCGKGHFYDEDRFDKCPHCGQPAVDETVAVNRNSDVTAALTELGSEGDPGAAASATGLETGTVGYYNQAIGTDPVVGWLVCIEGNHLGEDFKLKSGRNTIGRASGMDVPITGDNTVSREKHAFVIYDPQARQFLALPGEAKELSYLNGNLVLSAVELKANDVLTVGATKLMFFPCCTEAFHWDMVGRPNNN